MRLSEDLPFESLVRVKLSRSALLSNLSVYQSKHPGKRIAPVIKSNAYGHGLIPVARILETADVPFLIVDAYYEAQALREAGIQSPILLLGTTHISNILSDNLQDVTYAILSESQAQELARRADKPLHLHLKVDTGMNRQGISFGSVERVAAIVASNKRLEVSGLCTHLADADGPEPDLTLLQIERWNTLAKRARDLFPGVVKLHVAASAGSFWADRIEADMLRLGMGLYGYHPQPRESLPLRPVMQIEAPVSVIKWLEPGEKVGYNATFEAGERMPIGVVSTGYFSCVDRRLSNCGLFLVNGKECPIVGRVSMNVTTIDLRPAWPVDEGVTAQVISADPEAGNSVGALARLLDTIPYTIVTAVAGALPREIVERF